MNRNEGAERSVVGLRIFWGRVLCAFGILLAVVEAYFVSVATVAVGTALGLAAYALGARTFGATTIILCVVGTFAGLLIGQGVIPGSYDEAVNGIKESAQFSPAAR